ncbi:IS3 family transposase [Propionibacterium acidifaciens]
MRRVGDITYIPTWQGFAYLAVVMDCFSKKIIGHAIAGHMRTGLVTEALAMAVRNCPPIRGATVFHSDRGAQYTSAEYTKFMTDRGILPSVGRAGSCCGSAVAESFNAILKKELVNREVYLTRDHAIRDVTAWIELRCDHKRLRSAIDYQTPTESTPDGDNNTRQQPKTNH